MATTHSRKNLRPTQLLLLLHACLFLPASLAAQETQRIPRYEKLRTASVHGIVRDTSGRPVGGAQVRLEHARTGDLYATSADGDGIFRLAALPPGNYTLICSREGYRDTHQANLPLEAGGVVTLALSLEALPRVPIPHVRLPARGEPIPPTPMPEPAPAETERAPRPESAGETAAGANAPLASRAEVFHTLANRWSIQPPDWDRYGHGGEYPYVKGKWWDPFNRNRLKGDYPIFGQRNFLNLLLASDTFADFRRSPLPSNVSAARPGSEEFFGKGEQGFIAQTFRFAADFFRGDTSYRPVDFRFRITPAVQVNWLNTKENGIVNIDVRRGTNRLDAHAGLQEAFVEAKLLDLSSNYDFLSARAGIQSFSSDFRGFVFVDEQPGVRLFGNLRSNRLEYNLAYFFQLEKDTNSGLNTFDSRHQQVLIANLYIQDFFIFGYSTQFSLHFNKDDARVHYDQNNFLVRPAPIGAVQPHNIRSVYIGWTGNGHMGRTNINHAFYQALGRDDLNPIAGRRVTINAQMAAAEISYDRDWVRLKGSFLWASGDADPRDGRARGFDSIVDAPIFAGGIFSLWNHQGIRLTGTGVALTSPGSLLPNLRPNKEEGQSNFVNPGVFLFHAGADIELTPKLRSLININFLRFDRPESLELLLLQAPIRHTIGVDYSIGFQYRPPLSENIVILGGASALTPGQGFADIYTRKTLFSLFANLRFQF